MGNHWDDTKTALAENRGVQVTDYITVTYADDGVAQRICYIPAGAIVLEVGVNVTEGFNGGGTDLMRVGITGTPEKYLVDASVAAIGQINASQAASPLVPAARLTAEAELIATYNDANNDATEGSAEVWVMWAPCAEREV